MNFHPTSRPLGLSYRPSRLGRSWVLLACWGSLNALAGCSTPEPAQESWTVLLEPDPQSPADPGSEASAAAAGNPNHPNDPGGPWVLSKLLAQATAQAPSLELVRAQVARANAAVALAESAFGLRIDMGLDITTTNNPASAFVGELNANELDLAAGLDDTPWTPHSMAYLRAGTVLWDGGQREARLDAAEAARAALADLLGFGSLQVEGHVVELYFATQQARALAQSTLESRTATEAALEVAQSKAEAGTAMNSDVLSLEARIQELVEAELVANSARELAEGSLETLLDLPAGVLDSEDWSGGFGYHSAGSLQRWPQQADLEDVEALQLRAEESRPDVVAARTALHASELNLTAAQYGGSPVLSVYGQSWLDGGTPLGELDRGSAILGASLAWNLADGGAVEAGVTGARAEVRIARARLDQLLQMVELQIQNGARNLLLARARMESSAKIEASAEAAFVELSAGFESGSTTFERWLGAEAVAAQAKAHSRVAQVQAELARARLLLMLGSSLQHPSSPR